MKKLTLALAIGLFVFSYVKAQSPTAVSFTPLVDISTETLIERYSTLYVVSATQMERIMDCENKSHDPKLQSYARYTKDHPEWGVVKGQREESYGLVQIHIVDNDVTYEQATNPVFSVEFLAKNLKAGNKNMWKTCAKNLPDSS